MTALHVDRCLPDGFLRQRPARGRAGRPDRHAEVAAAQVVLRRARQRAVREDHPAARVLPDPRRAGDPAPPRRPRSRPRPAPPRWSSSAPARRTRPGCCSTRCGPRGTLRSYVPVDVSEAALIAAAHRRAGAATRACSVRAVVSDFEEHLGLPRRQTGARLVAFLGSTIGNLLPAAAGRLPGPAAGPAAHRRRASCSAPTWSRIPAVLRRRLRRRGRGHRRVQQERAGRAQRRARRRLRPGRVRPRRAVGRRPPSGSRCGCGRRQRQMVQPAGDRADRGVRRGGGDADRDVRQVPPGRGGRRAGRGRVRDARRGGPTPRAGSGCPCQSRSESVPV